MPQKENNCHTKGTIATQRNQLPHKGKNFANKKKKCHTMGTIATKRKQLPHKGDTTPASDKYLDSDNSNKANIGTAGILYIIIGTKHCVQLAS